MKARTVRYVLGQGLVGLWRNRTMSMASIGTVTATLIILGLIITLVLNISNLADLVQMQFDEIQVYLEDDLSIEEINNVGKQIEAINGVSEVIYESKEEALEKYKKSWGEEGYLLEGLEKNTLPNSYIIQMDNLELADSIVEKLTPLKGIDEIKYYKEIVDQLLRIARFVRTIGLIIILILILVAIFIISNTIKLTLNARRQEIGIMKNVGATNWFIRWPFLLEGMLLGLIGAIISTAVVYYGYQYAFNAITARFYLMFSAYMISVNDMMNKTIYIFAVLGIGVGALGSIFSLRRYLKV
ncbi:MAG: permease-like cell division protein FtsX [Natronincolaceae bacterium]|jgi:cell division transport system permease protein|nr:permease-like cell division protein FtsX [Bacillota bacterium]NLK91121.1 ABC transporter permease [Clostridiales bacterium]